MAIKNMFAKKKWKTAFSAGKEAFAKNDFGAAEFHLQNALEIAVTIDEQDSSYGDTALMLSQVQRRLEHYDKATELAGKAFNYYYNVFGGADSRTIQAHLSLVLSDPAQCHDGGDLRRATYAEADRQFGRSWQLVRVGALALQYFDGREKEKVLTDVQDACNHALGDGRHSELGAWPPVAEEFATQLSIMGYTDLAARFLAIQLQIHEEKSGERSDEAAKTRLALGLMYLNAGDYSSAETALVRALEQMKIKAGPKSEEVVSATVALGQTLARQGKLADAAPHMQEVLNKLGTDRTAERLEALVSLLEYKCLVQGSDSERGSLWRELEGLWEQLDNDEQRSEIYQGLMAAQQRLQQAWELNAADRFLQAVLARVRKWRGPHHPDVACVMMELALVALALDDDKKARTYAEQSLSLDEGVDNQIRAITFYARIGERSKSSQYSKMALRLLRTYDMGVEQGRRLSAYASSLLESGDTAMAINQAQSASEQLMEMEATDAKFVMAQAHTLEGRFSEAEAILSNIKELITEPYRRAEIFIGLAWIQCRTGRFPEMQESVAEVLALSAIRDDHPLLSRARAISAQGAFYSGNVFQGKEERDSVFSFLRDGRHMVSRRALPVLCLLDPFGPDESELELEVGQRILEATRYPEGEVTVFPCKDAACIGLRHMARAHQFAEQQAAAQERLTQLEHRFFHYYDKSNPIANWVYLTRAAVSTKRQERIDALEAARVAMKALGAKHVSLFGALNLLAEQYLEADDIGRARGVVSEALAMRRSRKLREWMEALEKGQNPLPSGDRAAVDDAEQAPPEPQVEVEALGTGEFVAQIDSLYTEPPSTEDEVAPVQIEISEPPTTEVEELQLTEQEPETLIEEPKPEPKPAEEVTVANAPTLDEPLSEETQATLVASGGATDLSQLSLARLLSERNEPPNGEEVEEFLAEVQARFGEELGPRREARVFLALLFPDSSQEAQSLWLEALDTVESEDFEGLRVLEARAHEAGAAELVLQTLERRLNDESTRYGENATESVETLNRMATVFEAQGQHEEAYHRVVLSTEILRSWFGGRSRRLLEPLASLVRLAEKQDDVDSALEHQVERHKLLEATEAEPHELFASTISLLPIRARRGQLTELLAEAEQGEKEVTTLGAAAAAEFGRALLGAARRVDHLHWRADVAAQLLEVALRATPESETSLRCLLDIAAAECQARRDYRAQGSRQRKAALENAKSLESDAWAELLHLAAESCLRVEELDEARDIAEMILEKRLAQGGRKDRWAGRALLVLAEADLRSYKLEGAETAIAMSRPSLEGSRYWPHARRLQAEAMFFLNKEAEAFQVLDSLPSGESLAMELPLAVWRGQADELCAQLDSGEGALGARWSNLESIPLGEAVSVLEFLGRAGKVKFLTIGMERIEPRFEGVLATDFRLARVQALRSTVNIWASRYDEAEAVLRRTLELIPEGRIKLPEGLSSLWVRGLLVEALLAQDKPKQAQTQARTGAAKAAELLGEEDIRAISFRSYSAYCSLALGAEEEALVLLDEILVPLQDALGETHVILRDIYRGLSRAFLKQDDLESARLTAEEALRIDRECRGLSLHLVQDLHLLSMVERREDLGEAGNLLDTALELAAEVLPENHPYIGILSRERAELDGAPVAEAEPVSPRSEDASEVEGEEDDEVEEQATEEETEDSVEEEPEVAEESLEEFAEESVERDEYEDEEQAATPATSMLSLLGRAETAPSEEVYPEEVSAQVGEEADDDDDDDDEVEASLDGWTVVDDDDDDDDYDDSVEQAPESQEEVEESADGLFVSQELREIQAEESESSEYEMVEAPSMEGALIPAVEMDDESTPEDSVEFEPLQETEVDDAEEPEESEQGGKLAAEEVAELETFEEEAPTDEAPTDEAPEEESLQEESVEVESVEASEEVESAEEASLEEVAEESSDDTLASPEDQAEPEQDLTEEVQVEESEELAADSDEQFAAEPESEEAEPEDSEPEDTEPEVTEPEDIEQEDAEQEDSLDEGIVSEVESDGVPSASVPYEAPRPYKLSAFAGPGPKTGSASIEEKLDFQQVPFRVPELQEPEIVLTLSQQVAAFNDPEAFLLPLAPVFFLPIPWKEATEAPFEKAYEELYERFQEAFANEGPWREVVEEAVSVARLDPDPAAGYFLFLVGAQLEKGSRLHSADICLATAIELLESGPAFGAACHLAGRVAGRRGELRRALDYFERSAELAEEAELAVLKVDAAECHLGLGRPEEALIAFEEVFDYLSENVPTVQALAVQAKMAQIHLLIGDPDSSQSLAEDTKERISPKNEGTYRVLGRILLSRAFARLGRHELALELAEQAWDGARRWSAKRREGRRIAISNLVDIYCLVGKFEQADEILRESGMIGWGLAESELLLRAGHVACALGKHVAARRYLRVGKSFLTRFRSPALWRASFLELEAELSLQLGDGLRAEHLSQQALELFEKEATGPVDRSRHLFRAARIQASLENMEEAQRLVAEAHGLRDLHLGAGHPHTGSVEGLTAILNQGQ